MKSGAMMNSMASAFSGVGSEDRLDKEDILGSGRATTETRVRLLRVLAEVVQACTTARRPCTITSIWPVPPWDAGMGM
jgi:hypothetical protein